MPAYGHWSPHHLEALFWLLMLRTLCETLSKASSKNACTNPEAAEPQSLWVLGRSKDITLPPKAQNHLLEAAGHWSNKAG